MILLSVDQTTVYEWLKEYSAGKPKTAPITTIATLDLRNTMGVLPKNVERSLRSLSDKEQFDVLQAYISWYNF